MLCHGINRQLWGESHLYQMVSHLSQTAILDSVVFLVRVAFLGCSRGGMAPLSITVDILVTQKVSCDTYCAACVKKPVYGNNL